MEISKTNKNRPKTAKKWSKMAKKAPNAKSGLVLTLLRIYETLPENTERHPSQGDVLRFFLAGRRFCRACDRRPQTVVAWARNPERRTGKAGDSEELQKSRQEVRHLLLVGYGLAFRFAPEALNQPGRQRRSSRVVIVSHCRRCRPING